MPSIDTSSTSSSASTSSASATGASASSAPVSGSDMRTSVVRDVGEPEIQHSVSDIKARGRGRPLTTSHDAVAGTALRLFAEHGFEATTVEDIAAATGVSRRTIFRYYPSKNDLVWGNFDGVLDRLRAEFAATDPSEPLMEALARAVIASNRYDAHQLPELRIRLTLISTVPALQAHSMLRYAEWRRVVAEFVAQRLGERPDDLVPE